MALLACPSKVACISAPAPFSAICDGHMRLTGCGQAGWEGGLPWDLPPKPGVDSAIWTQLELRTYLSAQMRPSESIMVYLRL